MEKLNLQSETSRFAYQIYENTKAEVEKIIAKEIENDLFNTGSQYLINKCGTAILQVFTEEIQNKHTNMRETQKQVVFELFIGRIKQNWSSRKSRIKKKRTNLFLENIH